MSMSATLVGGPGVATASANPNEPYYLARRNKRTGRVALYKVRGGQSQRVAPVLFYHNTPLDFGYPGAGAAALALTVLADYFGVGPGKGRRRAQLTTADPCVRLHQAFKWRYLVADSGATITIPFAAVAEFVAGYGYTAPAWQAASADYKE